MDGTSEISAPRSKVCLKEVDKMTQIKNHRIVIELSEADFEESMGREPRDQDEFDEWAMLAEKGLLNGHIDWDIIYKCTHDAMEDRGDGH